MKVHPTKHWHTLEDGRVQCDVCPRECRMHEGQRGLCFVRGVEGGEVKLYTYGRSSGFCVDPSEKKPLNHFLPGTSVLSFGTAGCNLACKFCQNWDMSKSREMDTLQDQATPEMLAAAVDHLLVQPAFAAPQGGRLRLGGRDLGGDRGCTVQTLQPQQMAAGIDDRDAHGPVVLQGLGLGGRGNGLDVGRFEDGDGFHGCWQRKTGKHNGPGQTLASQRLNQPRMRASNCRVG